VTEFLVFTIYAPWSSRGDIAVGEERGSWDRPSRSAILGFVAGALGIVREDQAAHDELDAGFGMAVWANRVGTPMVDYHTTQTVAASVVKKRRLSTRAELMSVADRETILSRRTYREDALYTIALWSRSVSRWTLPVLEAALRRPVFVPYAGRKSNPLGLPAAPEIVSAATIADALIKRADHLWPAATAKARSWRTWDREVSYDPCDGFESGLTGPVRRNVQRDARPHRMRWQFAERVVETGLLDVPTSAVETNHEAVP
jgi:CRISPR system Cascade subunit CasD